MREGVLLYFSEEEFAVMMELAGGQEYALFLQAPELDGRRVREAFASLFHRGFLERRGECLTLSGSGAFFRKIRDCGCVVLVRGETPEIRQLLCYVGREKVYLAEILSGAAQERYRLSVHACGEMERLLIESQILPRPFLQEEDTLELERYQENGLGDPEDGGLISRMTKYTPGGEPLFTFALFNGPAGREMRIQDEDGTETHLYSQEMLKRIMRRCFGG